MIVPRIRFISFLFLALMICAGSAMPSLAQAADVDTTYFKAIPVLQDGRVKPLDSFARTELRRFSGKDHIDGKDAADWLAQTLFNPAEATQEKIFRIENANTRHLLGLEERKIPLYAYSELVPGLEKTFPSIEDLVTHPDKNMAEDQKSLLHVHENALEYTRLLRSFSLLLPLDISLSDSWRKKAGLSADEEITYLKLKKIDPDIQDSLKKIIRKKGKDPEKYSDKEQATAMLGWQISTIESAAARNDLLRVIPDRLSKDPDSYLAPWEIVNAGKGSPETARILDMWQDLAVAWQSGDPQKWTAASAKIAGRPSVSIRAELVYNLIQPFFLSTIFYALSFLFVLLFLSLRSVTKFLYPVSLGLLLAALGLQGLGILARITILERPPVGTLYESILFVGWIAPAFALLLEWRVRNRLGILCAGLTGAAIGLLGLSMADEGDSMKVLGAVLNTRFWLATHVLCITIGYGWCLVSSVIAHILLIGQALHKLSPPRQEELRRALDLLALTSLLFTATGTILGGIWADQSWGRFWGWDPKENGALLIVLWLVWIVHGRVSGEFSRLIATMGYAFLSVIVGLAWIGVNLLGVGLHSYGFTEGLFRGLGIFAFIEVALIGYAGWSISQSSRRRLAA